MDQSTVKSLLLRDKGFLKELAESSNGPNNKRILFSADTAQLNTLIKCLHLIANGEIKVSKKNFQIISQSKKLKLIQHHVESKKSAFHLLSLSRKEKLDFLLKLANVYSALLFNLFNL